MKFYAPISPIPLTPFPVGRGRSCKEEGLRPLSKSLPLSFQERGLRGEVGDMIKSVAFDTSWCL